MKIKISIGILTFSTISTAFAGENAFNVYNKQNGNQLKEEGNAITLTNKSSDTISYQVYGVAAITYGIEPQDTDIYHTGFGDTNAHFLVGYCSDVYPIFHNCNKGISNLHVCTDTHYNFKKVASITVNSQTSCDIVCIDGGRDSCKVSENSKKQ